jgi:hypothetical protein
MRSPISLACLAVLFTITALPRAAAAAWPHDPTVNLPVATRPTLEEYPIILPDGHGGALITWDDGDIYAQHVLATGTTDPAWPTNGRPLCLADSLQLYPQLDSDGAGGAIVVWQDKRNGDYDIYAQHELASGAVDPQWPMNGLAVSTAVGDQDDPSLVSDGAGGAIVIWYDDSTGNWLLYAQHVLASGIVDPAWPASGRLVSGPTGPTNVPAIVPDGAGGGIVMWNDSGITIRAQHVMSTGSLDPAWPAAGRAVSGLSNAGSSAIASDGAGGAIVAWRYAAGAGNFYMYAQHVRASGALDPGWPANGLAVSNGGGERNPRMVSDGAGGAFMTWQDVRTAAQHVLASGVPDPAWPASGVFSANGDIRYLPTITADGAGGAITTWKDLSNNHIYAAHMPASGVPEPTWPATGVAVCTATGAQAYPTIVSDAAGGAIITWIDGRGVNPGIYAQRVGRFGYLGTPEAEITGVADVPEDQGGHVTVSWNASYLDLNSDPNLTAYDIYRSVPAAAARERISRGTRVARGLSGVPVAGAAALIRMSAQDYTWEYLATTSPDHFSSSYSYVAPTAQDSTGAANPNTAFMIVARNTSGTMTWPSRPDSGYSVDNLAPLAPTGLAGESNGGVIHVHWHPNSEADLAGYRLHRGASADFTPGPANLIASPADTAYDDPTAEIDWYKLSAVDVHGNESGFTTLSPGAVTGAPPGSLPQALALARPWPNPASGAVTLRYALPRAASVSLAIFDASGRRVRGLVSGTQPAGERSLAWDMRDDTGHPAHAGLYFVRLDVEGLTLSHRFTALR